MYIPLLLLNTDQCFTSPTNNNHNHYNHSIYFITPNRHTPQSYLFNYDLSHTPTTKIHVLSHSSITIPIVYFILILYIIIYQHSHQNHITSQTSNFNLHYIIYVYSLHQVRFYYLLCTLFKHLENMIAKLWIFNPKIFFMILDNFSLKNDVPTSNITSIMGDEIQILSPIIPSICTMDARYSPKVLCNMHKDNVETLLKTLKYLSLFNIFHKVFNILLSNGWAFRQYAQKWWTFCAHLVQGCS